MAKAKKTAAPKGTPTTERERAILSGLFALTNMGQPMPRDMAQVLDRLYRTPTLTIQNATMAFCQDYMENDDQQAMFFDEAKHWHKETFSKAKWTREEITRVWPEKAVVFREAAS